MRLKRFDKQLQSVFMVLSGLTVLVGLVSVAVNSYLVRLQGDVLAESIAVIERTESVALDADLAVSLAARLGTAGTAQEVADTERTLVDRVSRIRNDVLAMNVFLTGATGEIKEARKALDVVSRMSDAVRRLQAVNASSAESQARLVAAGLSLTDLISRQKNLARLRITAGIWEMYSARDGAGTRHNLDLLADADFFAFERLGELGDAAAAMIRLVQGLSSVARQDDVSVWSADFHASLDLAKARTPFMPSTAARRKAEDDLRILAGAEAEEGLIALQHARLSDVARLDTLSAELRGTLEALAAVAADGRTQVRARMQEGVAAAGRRAVLLTAGLAAAVVVSLVAGHMVWSRTRTRVVLRLNAVAGRIVAVARGETGRPMPISGHDEIGRLEKSINVLRRRAQEAARLRQSLEAAVRARTADVVAEMRSANAARAEAEELGRAKIHFLARMSHEIRTPLNGLIGMLDLLLPEEQSPLRRSRLQAALTSARDLQAMTEDILAFSSGEDRTDGARQVPFDPGLLARDLAEHLQALSKASKLETAVDIPANLPSMLIGDAARIRQVIVNLISNAVKYTRAGKVRLVVSHRALASPGRHEIAFTVSDTGPGMTPEEVRDAFDIYGRTMDAHRRGLPGVGLGLAIVRQLTDMIGGELRVATQVGQGSSFTLALKLEEAQPETMAETVVMPSPRVGLHVLVVDDDLVSRLVARGYLERMGARVTEAASGEEALAETGRFDAILLDRNLPGLRGEEVAARIVRNGARVALLTADPVQDDPASLNVDQVLRKPISSRALADFLAQEAGPPPQGAADTPERVLQADVADMGREAATEIVSAFLDDLAEGVPHLLEDADVDRRKRLAHRLKGAAANFALHDLCALLGRFEAGDAGALAAIAPRSAEADARLRTAAGRAGLQLSSGRTKQ